MSDVKKADPDPNVNDNGEGGQGSDDPGQRFIPANEVNEIVSKRVNEVTSKFTEKMARMEGELDAYAKQSAKPQQEDKIYTRAELNAFVNDGKLTQDEADNVVDKQLRKQVTADVTKNMTLQGKENAQQTMINDYIAHDPDIAIPGTDARNRIEGEVRAQLELSGDTEATLRHEVLALRAIYGDVKNLTQVNLNPEQRDTHMDTMTGGDGGSGHTKQSSAIKVDDSGNITGLSRDEKSYYQDLINKGTYSGWAAVAEEMKYADTALRQRVGSRR